jgi:hypothetical protein
MILSVPACSKKNASKKGIEQSVFELAGSRPNIILIMADDLRKENPPIIIEIEKYLEEARVDSEYWIAE